MKVNSELGGKKDPRIPDFVECCVGRSKSLNLLSHLHEAEIFWILLYINRPELQSTHYPGGAIHNTFPSELEALHDFQSPQCHRR